MTFKGKKTSVREAGCCSVGLDDFVMWRYSRGRGATPKKSLLFFLLLLLSLIWFNKESQKNTLNIWSLVQQGEGSTGRGEEGGPEVG